MERKVGPSMSGIKKDDLLSFKSVGRLLSSEQDIRDEFVLMKQCLKHPFTRAVASRIARKSGTHLVKLVSPRADGDNAILVSLASQTNRRPDLMPSTNAPDIPFCKVVYRPLEIEGHPSRSVIDHIINPEDHSSKVLDAFAEAFGADVLVALHDALHEERKGVEKLGAGEFPIIFLPHPGGGDLQVTPVSPAASFMAMKTVTNPYFLKATKERPRPRRGKWHRQAVSAKPQNISGAIGGPRVRFLATMPAGLLQADAELYRFVRGGGFPRWRDEDVAIWVRRYADMLDADSRYNDRNTRAALDRTADRLIRDAREFAHGVLMEARQVAERDGLDIAGIAPPPNVGALLIRRKWGSDDEYGRVRKALTSPHFEHRLHLSAAVNEVVA